ncbi:MAG: 2-phospho-L-lactate guanylyltransferase [Actinomycetota bacterium]
MLPTALVPVRAGPTAKRRLAHVLGPLERDKLVRALFAHVVSTLDQAGLKTIALAPDAIDAPAGVEVWRDAAPGLNRAIAAALRRLETPILIVHADLPRLQADDIDRVLTAPGDVVVARSRDGGTNGLLLRRLIAPGFGPGSAAAHASRARSAGLRATVIDTPGLALDVDDETSLSASGAWSVRGTRP